MAKKKPKKRKAHKRNPLGGIKAESLFKMQVIPKKKQYIPPIELDE